MWELGRAELHFFLWVIISSCRNYRCHRRLRHHFTPLFHRHTCSAPDVSSGLFSLGGKKQLCCLTVCINREPFLCSFEHISFQTSHWHWNILQFSYLYVCVIPVRCLQRCSSQFIFLSLYFASFLLRQFIWAAPPATPIPGASRKFTISNADF